MYRLKFLRRLSVCLSLRLYFFITIAFYYDRLSHSAL
jgi:hypothetical protein